MHYLFGQQNCFGLQLFITFLDSQTLERKKTTRRTKQQQRQQN